MNYSKIYRLLAPLLRKLYRLEVTGDENLPANGGYIVAANHTALADVILLSVAANERPIKFMAKKELFSTPIAPLIKAFGAFPVDRGHADVASIKTMISLVESGDAVGIFPQGTRCGGRDPRTTEIKSGVGLIAYRSKAPVVPVMLENDQMKIKMFVKNHIIIGKPILYDDLGFTDGGKEQYTAASRIIFDRICSLKYDSPLPSGEKPTLTSPNEDASDEN